MVLTLSAHSEIDSRCGGRTDVACDSGVLAAITHCYRNRTYNGLVHTRLAGFDFGKFSPATKINTNKRDAVKRHLGTFSAKRKYHLASGYFIRTSVVVFVRWASSHPQSPSDRESTTGLFQAAQRRRAYETERQTNGHNDGRHPGQIRHGFRKRRMLEPCGLSLKCSTGWRNTP